MFDDTREINTIFMFRESEEQRSNLIVNEVLNLWNVFYYTLQVLDCFSSDEISDDEAEEDIILTCKR